MEESRKIILRGFFILIGAIYLIRLFYLQVIDDSYRLEAEGNAIKKIIQVPFRGLIYDRFNKQMVTNQPVYDLYVTPKKVQMEDTLRFCNLWGISKIEFDSLFKVAKAYSPVKSSVFLRQLSVEDFAKAQDAMVDYPGFSFEKNALRSYTTKSSANVLGYTAEVSEKELLKQEEEGGTYYRQGDYVGKSGIEKYYEQIIRGQRGVKYVMVNVRGVEKGRWQEGKNDTMAVAGQNLYTSLDLALQEYGDSLMRHKVGSIVAIEPKTGEILAMVSGPSYDPNTLTGRNFSKAYSALLKDPNKPLINRALQSQYRPGSTFKLIQAAVAMQEGVITPATHLQCGGVPMHCHGHGSPDLRNAIRGSCNPYFYRVFQRMLYNNSGSDVFRKSAIGLQKWHDYVDKFGIGRSLGVDLPNERKGTLPSVEMFNKRYKGEYRWKFSNVYSLSIGEGEIDITPLKMANVAAIMANQGYYITPHVVKGIGKVGNIPDELKARHETGISRHHFNAIQDGMVMAVNNGTVGVGARIPDIQMCGKTGTSQNARGDDHSIFIAFAPRENPKIAIAVFAEYAGYGGTHAAPIAGLMIEKYLKRRVDRKGYETEIMNRNYLTKIPHVAPKIVLANNIPSKKDSIAKKNTTNHKQVQSKH